MGIKTLSPFSIPGINGFRGDVIIKKIFKKEHVGARLKILKNGVSAEYHKYLEQDHEDGKLRVHDRHLSGDRSSSKARKARGTSTSSPKTRRGFCPQMSRPGSSFWCGRSGRGGTIPTYSTYANHITVQRTTAGGSRPDAACALHWISRTCG